MHGHRDRPHLHPPHRRRETSYRYRRPQTWPEPRHLIKRVALESTQSSITSDAKLERLATLVRSVYDAVEDEIDCRAAAAAWSRHLKSGAKTLSGEEARRALEL